MSRAALSSALFSIVFIGHIFVGNVAAQSRIFPSGRAQVEAHIAVNPTNSKNLIAAAITQLVPTPNMIGIYMSTDGGTNWTGTDNISGSISAGDPVVAFDPDGNAYLLYQVIDASDLYLHKSTNGGSTWSDRVTIHHIEPSSGRVDRPWMAISPVRNASGFFDIYVSHSIFDINGETTTSDIQLRKSSNGGENFAPVHTITHPVGFNLQGSSVGVGPGGDVFLAWAELDGATGQVKKIRGARSTDGGSTFGNMVEVSTLQIGAKSESNFFIKGGAVRADSYPRIAVDQGPGPTGNFAYIAWSGMQTSDGSPDILMTRWKRNPDASFSWSGVEVIDEATGDQWMPALSVSQDGVVSVLYYSSNPSLTDPISTQLRYLTNGGINVSSAIEVGTPGGFVVNGVTGFVGDYHGVASGFERGYGIWTEVHDHGSDDPRQAYFKAQSTPLQIPSTHQLVEVDQRDESNQSFDKVGRWNQGAFTEYTVPHQFLFGTGSSEVLRAKQEFKAGTTQKYNNWDGVTDAVNHRSFDITTGLVTLRANFNSATNVTIQTEFVDGGSGGMVGFKDPWLIDETDQYGARNRGHQEAELYFHPSPFVPSTGSPYKGIFLAQGDTMNLQPPYYTVRAVDGPQGFIWQFLHWRTEDVYLQNRYVPETPAVFLNANGKAIARFKAHLGTSNPVSYSAQRKIARGTTVMPDVLVYESAGDIYYLSSTDNGTTWSQDNTNPQFPQSRQERVSDGTGKAAHPSVESIHYDIGGVGFLRTYVVWEENPYNDTGYRIWLRERDEANGAWNDPVPLYANPGARPAEAVPVISSKIVVWRGPEGIFWKRIAYSGETAQLVQGTDVNSINPSFDLQSLDDGTVHVAWEQANHSDRIRYVRGTINVEGTMTWASPLSITTTSGGGTPSRPVLVRDYSGNACIAWEQKNTSTGQGSIQFRRVDPTGVLSSVVELGSTSGGVYPMMPSLSHHRNYGSDPNRLTLVWHVPNGGTKYAVYRTGSGWTGTLELSSTGQYASVAKSGLDGSSRLAYVVSNSGPPYAIQTPEVPEPPAPASAPTLASPVNGATNISISPTLSWNASAGASTYHLQVGTDINFNYIVVNQSNIGATSSSVGLDYNTTYYWRVRAVNAGGESAWSSTWSFTTELQMVSITVTTDPVGLSISVNGGGYTSPYTFSSPAGESASISTNTPQDGQSGTRYEWNSWSDGGAISHNIAPVTDASYTAAFITQHFLTVDGPWFFSPSGSGWYNEGSTPSACIGTSEYIGGNTRYYFTGWSGDASGTSTCVGITMNGPKTVTAQYSYQYWVSINQPTGGSINASSGWYDYGAILSISATPNSGYTFSHWDGSGYVPAYGSSPNGVIEVYSDIIQQWAYFDQSCIERSAPPWAYAFNEFDYVLPVYWPAPSGSCPLRFNIYRRPLGGGGGWELIAQDYGGLDFNDYPPPYTYGYNEYEYQIVTVSTSGQEIGGVGATGGMYWW